MANKSAIVGTIQDFYGHCTWVEFMIEYKGKSAVNFSVDCHLTAAAFLEEMLNNETKLQVAHRVLIQRAIELLEPLPDYENQDWWAKNAKEASTMASVFTMQLENSEWEHYVSFEKVTWEFYNQLKQDEMWEQAHPYPFP